MSKRTLLAICIGACIVCGACGGSGGGEKPGICLNTFPDANITGANHPTSAESREVSLVLTVASIAEPSAIAAARGSISGYAL